MAKARLPAREVPTKDELLQARLMRPREAAAYLNVSLKTLNRLPIRRVYLDDQNENLRRYRPEDLEAWVKARSL